MKENIWYKYIDSNAFVKFYTLDNKKIIVHFINNKKYLIFEQDVIAGGVFIEALKSDYYSNKLKPYNKPDILEVLYSK